MTRDVTVLFYLFVCLLTCEALSNYEVPTPMVEALYPKGFRITVKDDGFTFFGFRININKEFLKINEGEIKVDLLRPKGGKWIYKNRDIKLEVGDTIFYWIYVIKNGKGHMETDFEYTVTGYVKEDGTPVGQPVQPDQVAPTPTPNSQPPAATDDIDIRFDTLDQNCPVSKTMVQGRTTICKDTLIFNEEFDKGSLRELTQWDAEIKFPRGPDFPFNVYLPDNTVSFEDGSLVITPVLTESLYHEGFLQEKLNLNSRCTGRVDTDECNQEASGAQIIPPVTTAKLTTKRSFNFKFGRIEVRAKLPSGNWLVPEINLEPSELTYGPDRYESGLMRVAFTRGNPNQAKKLYGGPILSDAEPYRSLLLQEKIGINNWDNDFHNYTMIWKPDGMELFADGEQYGTVNPGEGFHSKMNGVEHANHWVKGTVMAPLDQMFHLTLGLRVGGVNDFSDDLMDKPWKNRGSKAMLDFWKKKDSWHPTWFNSNLKIDYIRVFAL